MARILFLVFLISFSTTVFAQEMSMPTAIAVSKSSHLILHTYAKGVQVYICQRDPKDTLHNIWIFKEPRAVLYKDHSYHNAIGKHYFDEAHNPTWEITDGSKVTGKKVVQVNSTDSLAIPWLLLSAANTQGPGNLKATTFIQRIATQGGKSPEKSSMPQQGAVIEISYTAEYLFYSGE